MDAAGCKGSRSHSVVFPKTQTASVLPPLEPFLLDVQSLVRAVWSGKTLATPHWQAGFLCAQERKLTSSV
jgi:hypothetical protein